MWKSGYFICFELILTLKLRKFQPKTEHFFFSFAHLRWEMKANKKIKSAKAKQFLGN